MECFPLPGPFPVVSALLVILVSEVAVGGVSEFPPDQCRRFDRNIPFQYRAPEAEGATIRRDRVELPCFASGAIEANCRLGPVFWFCSFVECEPGRLRTGSRQSTKEQQEQA